jgi:hypothetical protein
VTNAVETEKYLLFQPHHLGAGNAHHAIEDLCTRVAQRRMSSNILLVTGPVSAGGDRAATRKASSPTFQRRSRQQQHLHCHQPPPHPHSCRESQKSGLPLRHAAGAVACRGRSPAWTPVIGYERSNPTRA